MRDYNIPRVDKQQRDYSELFKVGTVAQLEKLNLYENKGEFPTDLKLLYLLMQGEVKEVGIDLYMDDPEAIRLEAADVANYAHMIILECERRINSERQKQDNSLA